MLLSESFAICGNSLTESLLVSGRFKSRTRKEEKPASSIVGLMQPINQQDEKQPRLRCLLRLQGIMKVTATWMAGMYLNIAVVARQNKNWSMRKVADELGLEHQTVMYWNQGRAVPRLPQFVKLCRLLECSMDDLIMDEPQLRQAHEDSGPVSRRGHCPQVVMSWQGSMGIM